MNCQEIDLLAPLYLTDELDSTQAARFAAHLESCASCAAEIRQQRDLDARLREGVMGEGDMTDTIDAAALSARVRKNIGDARRIQRGKWIAAASIAAMLLVAIGGYRLFSKRDAALCADAADDHRTEVVEHQRRNWLTDPSAIAQLASRQGLQSAAPVALAPPGYHLERGKLCRLDGRVFLHLVYSDGAHEFSFFLRDRPAAEPTRAMAASLSLDQDTQHVASVENARFTALVVTDESHAAAREIANFTAKRL
jgi:anti-sigma factor RsiW